MPNVKNIIAVASGKGGVGKSTTAANLALALAAEGAKVGVLDADIYGPSQPMMLGIDRRPGKRRRPDHGAAGEPRHPGDVDRLPGQPGRGDDLARPDGHAGAGAAAAPDQLADLDYLIVDMPPGTGDIQLTLSQRVPMTGAVIVTTPQDIALIDARKAVTMFEKVGVPILGVVENMAVHVCSNCGHAEHIFGEGGGKRYAQEKGIDYLGALPLDMQIREQADSGKPTVVADPTASPAKIYKEHRAPGGDQDRHQGEGLLDSKFPTITVSKNT
jgi:ATP-binding protein involved in chromosome partitioning